MPLGRTATRVPRHGDRLFQAQAATAGEQFGLATQRPCPQRHRSQVCRLEHWLDLGPRRPGGKERLGLSEAGVRGSIREFEPFPVLGGSLPCLGVRATLEPGPLGLAQRRIAGHPGVPGIGGRAGHRSEGGQEGLDPSAGLLDTGRRAGCAGQVGAVSLDPESERADFGSV